MGKEKQTEKETMNDLARDGYSLKKHLLKEWIYAHGHTQPYVARRIGISAEEFKRKLRAREHFTRDQIERLVYLMGAEAAFRIIFFPSYRERRRVWEEVFGDKAKGGDRD